MPKLACPCGYVHNLSPVPDEGFRVVRDRDYDELIEAERVCEALWHAAEGTPEWETVGEKNRFIYDAVSSLYECPECGRLMWERERGKPFRVFLPENPKGRGRQDF
jgi:hypothetical protein